MIPGLLISLLTFPGVIVHEIAHRFFCDRAKVPVYEICYFRLGNPAGYVLHKPTTDLRSSFLISVGPFLINSVLCILLTFPYAARLMIESTQYPGSVILLAWLGYSIGMHAFPSNDDIQNFTEQVAATKDRTVLYYAARLFRFFMFLVNGLRFFWIDLLYALAISFLLPTLLPLLV